MLNLLAWLKRLLTEPAQEVNHNARLSPLMENFGDVDNEAIVTIAIPAGRIGQVRFAGSWWTARCPQKVKVPFGQVVYVVGRHNNTLYVQPGSVR